MSTYTRAKSERTASSRQTRRDRERRTYAYRLGIDSGGTFTDLTLSCPSTGQIWEHKVPSTPQDPSNAIIAGIEQIAAQASVSFEEIEYFGHGTTVATNTLIQLNGAKCALLTTAGFKDLLEIGRQRRPDLYDFYADKPPVLIPRYLRKEVSERLLADGSTLRPLDQEELAGVIDEALTEDVESIAICFLYSYLNDKHERLAKKALRKARPDLYIYTSSEVLPEFREFERLSTTVLCAYLGPIVGRYSERLAARAKAIGIPGQVHVMQSSGGIMSALTVKEKPIETALSGPAGGVIASAWLGEKVETPNLITLDMGGTSADVCLISGGVPALTTERSLAGYPVKVPMLDVHTIGAGGGSIAWVDDGGALKVGPMSAGADPGPACYGKGATAPTVTDANLVLGRITAGDFLGGRMAIQPELARQAVEKGICQRLGLDLLQAARGIMTIVNDNMVRAVRAISVERGYDPREFTLLAFGGAGPLHAVDVARELGIREVLVPSSPGTFSSLGLLISDYRSDFVRTRILPAEPPSLSRINDIFAQLSANAVRWLSREKIPRSKMRLRASVDARYRKQNYELRVELEDVPLTAAGLKKLVALFNAEHKKNHGYAMPEIPLELVSYRVTAVGLVPKTNLRAGAGQPSGKRPSVTKLTNVYLDKGSRFVKCPILALDDLKVRSRLQGPAIVEHCGSTTWIPPKASAAVDEYRNLRIRV